MTKSAANVDPGWIDFDGDAAMERVLKRPVHLVNDADAAGVAEMRFGVGVGRMGTVFLITLGTGTGSASTRGVACAASTMSCMASSGSSL